MTQTTAAGRSGRATWPAASYEQWSRTCDTLHAHTQVLGKIATALAPPEPELQHAALRLTARGWETLPLPAPDGSGAVALTVDLRRHEVLVEHSGGDEARIALTPHRSVGTACRDVLAAVRRLAGQVHINPAPQEVPWTVPLDEDDDHADYDPEQVGRYFAAATRAAAVLAEFRAPFRGRATPVNAWWGTFDLAVTLFSGREEDPPGTDFITRNAVDRQTVTVGWWPGDRRYPRAAFYAYAFPAPQAFARAPVSPAGARFDANLGEFVLDWDDVRVAADPQAAGLLFARSVFRSAGVLGDWDEGLARSVDGVPPPLRPRAGGH
jgi:Family of unknown function (DUF5996)